MIENGLNFTVSTMRTPASLMEPLRGLNLKLPVIAMDGAALYNIIENRYEHVYIISAEHCDKILDYFEGKQLPYLKKQLRIEKTVTFGTIEGKYTYLIKPGDFNRVVKLVKRQFFWKL